MRLDRRSLLMGGAAVAALIATRTPTKANDMPAADTLEAVDDLEEVEGLDEVDESDPVAALSALTRPKKVNLPTPKPSARE